MSAMPVPSYVPPQPLPGPLTAEEYGALPEDIDHRFELQEGAIVMCPRPVLLHQHVLGEFYLQLRPQVPPELKLLLEIDLDLQLVPPSAPGTVRVPDFVVVTMAGFTRVRSEGGLLRAAEVVLAGELHSPSTRRVDTRIKHDEYADAGIGHYWMIDLDAVGGAALTACHLGGPFGYVDDAPVTGTFTTTEPFPAQIDLTALLA